MAFSFRLPGSLLLPRLSGAVLLALVGADAARWLSAPAAAPGALSQLGLCLAALALVATSRGAVRHHQGLARTDPLTGLNNRRAFFELGAAELQRLGRQRLPVTVVYVDCDHFKEVNDSRGHAAGDRLLGEVAQALAGAVRRTDLLARLGGDEFAVLLPGASADDARRAVESLRGRLALAMRAGGWPVTFSLGVATWDAAPATVGAALELADVLLYEAKRAGRDAARFVEVAHRRQAA